MHLPVDKWKIKKDGDMPKDMTKHDRRCTCRSEINNDDNNNNKEITKTEICEQKWDKQQQQ